jgi:signal transduction histidine kinase
MSPTPSNWRQDDASSAPLTTFADVDIRCELDTRIPHVRAADAERHAYALLAAQTATDPTVVFRVVADLALHLCAAQTSGVTVVEAKALRWVAAEGALATLCGDLQTLDAGPWGVCVDQDTTQLLHLPDRHFPSLSIDARIVEMLLVPFRVRGQAVGALCIATHDADRRFDREDERMLRSLADFVSAAWQLQKASDSSALGRRKDEFLALLGHELRNPLAAMTTAISILRQDLAPAPRARRALDVLDRQQRHMTRLADDLLDAGRIANGKLLLQTRRLNLAQVVSDAIASCRTRLDEHALRLTMDLPPNPVWVDGDVVRLTQVVCNLIDNASKYTPTRGRVSVSCAAIGDDACVVISDSGRGIHPDQLQLIFQPFVQLPDAASDREGGLGLGLSLVRSVIELHGGRVDGYSDGPGRGCRFTIRLPRLAGSGMEASAQEEERTSRAAGS